MNVPLHRFVKLLDLRAVPADQHRCQIMLDHRHNGMAALAAGIAIANAFCAISQGDGDRDQLEKCVVTMFGIDQNFCQRDLKQPRLNTRYVDQERTRLLPEC